LPELKERIASATFISSLHAQLKETINDKDEIETYIQNNDFFFHADYANDEVINILARFYAITSL